MGFSSTLVNAPVCTTGFGTIAKGFGGSGRGWFEASTFGGSIVGITIAVEEFFTTRGRT
jgi:hypothetical protein